MRHSPPAVPLEPFGLYFLDEQFWPDNVQGLPAINAAGSTPIATGERMTHLTAFRDLFVKKRHLQLRSEITLH